MAISKRINDVNSSDRRRGKRFAIQEAVQYRLMGVSGLVAVCGTGTSLNFSKSGIEFTTETELPVGSTVEVSVDWPVKLDEHCALKFVGMGRVIRSEGQRASVKIYQHELKTRGRRQPTA